MVRWWQLGVRQGASTSEFNEKSSRTVDESWLYIQLPISCLDNFSVSPCIAWKEIPGALEDETMFVFVVIAIIDTLVVKIPGMIFDLTWQCFGDVVLLYFVG